MMKVIFLDVDGVLNIMSDRYRTFMKPYGHHIEEHLVHRLNYIINKADANIVISSSWRGDMEDLQKQLENQGFKYWDRVIGKTGRDSEGHRGNEIKQWLDSTEHSIDRYCVIDDETTDICGTKCRAIQARFVVQVDMNEGLSQNDADRILYVLEDMEIV